VPQCRLPKLRRLRGRRRLGQVLERVHSIPITAAIFSITAAILSVATPSIAASTVTAAATVALTNLAISAYSTITSVSALRRRHCDYSCG
jgi:membrane-bound metal-dependent hydrolase YbcI (DUF457 family)